MSDGFAAEARRCSSCGIELAATLLACPACQSLVHRERLAAIAREVESETSRDKKIALWREALALLPVESKQHAAVRERLDVLIEGPETGWIEKLLSPVTLVSMMISVIVYGSAMSFPIAVAVIIGILIHEMGHVVAIRRRGLRAGPPTFIPGLGAFVSLKQEPETPADDAFIGLAGPLFGLFAAVAAFVAWRATGLRFWGEIAQFTALLNLVNLTPIWQLDGGRGFHALTRPHRIAVLIVVAIAFAITREKTLIVVGCGVLWQVFRKDAITSPDWRAFATYTLLVIVFSSFTLFTI